MGHHVCVLDDLSSGRPENIEEVLATDPAHRRYADRFRFVNGSVVDETAVDEAFGDGPDIVFHQAAIPSVPRSFSAPGATLRANVEGTTKVLEACRRTHVGRLVFASSSSVYGDTPTLPKHEEMTPHPLSPYALSKLAGEHLCSIYSGEYGISTAALRYFNVFGPRQDPTSQYAAVVPNFVQRLLAGKPPQVYGDGRQSRDFTYVENVVAANLLAAGLRLPARGSAGETTPRAASGDPEALIVNIGTGNRKTLLDLIEALQQTVGGSVEPEFAEPRAGDVRHSHAAIEKARESFGYEPVVGFEEGLRRTVADFRERTEGPRVENGVGTATER